MNLKEAWPWEPPYLNLMTQVSVGLGSIGSIVGYLIAGPNGLWFLAALPIGFAWRAIYQTVGQRVTKLTEQYLEEPGDIEVGLLVIGKWEAPGVVVKRDREVVFHAIVGDPYTAPIEELQLFRNGHSLPGKYLWGKRGFIFEPHNGTRLGFGVREPIGRRWASAFRRSPRFK